MADVLVKPAFVSPFLDGPDATKLQPSNWNAARLFTGGSAGELLVRDTGSATGAAWGAPDGVYNVKRYGAVGDGVADDTAEIQAALTAAVAGGVVYFPRGTYKVTSVLTVTSRIWLVGEGMEISKLVNENTGGAALVHFADTSSANDEVRFSGVRDLWLFGNSASGAGLLVYNSYHFFLTRVKIESHGGIGADFQKGVGSTYGQNVFIDGCWIVTNRAGGVRLGGSSTGGDIAKIARSSINTNGFYGIYLFKVVCCEIDNNEIGGYQYGSLIAAHQAVPVCINGGNNITISHNSFEGNGGNAGTARSYSVRTGWNGDSQASAANNTQVITLDGNDFKASDGTGDTTHVQLDYVHIATVRQNLFEKPAGNPYNVNGVDIGANNAAFAGFRFEHNYWQSTLNANITGTVLPLLWNEVPWGSSTPNGMPGYGYRVDNFTSPAFFCRFGNEGFDRYQVFGDGAFLRGTGAAAPTVKFSHGAGSPEGVLTAGIGSLYQRSDGGAGTTLYVKESGTGNTGWIPVSAAAAAGALTGATLAANVLASSLTSVGTLANLSIGSANYLTWASRGLLRSPANGAFTINLNNETIGSHLKVDALPTIASGFGSGAAIVAGSTPLAGAVNVGTTPGAAGTINFNGAAFPSTPFVVATQQLTNTIVKAVPSTTQIAFAATGGWSNNEIISWIAISSK